MVSEWTKVHPHMATFSASPVEAETTSGGCGDTVLVATKQTGKVDDDSNGDDDGVDFTFIPL